MQIDVPRAAPPEIPSVYGSTRGLRNMPCSITPARLNAPPIAKPNMMRGNRISTRMLYSEVPLPSSKIDIIFVMGIPAEPMHNDKAPAATRNADEIRIENVHRDSLFFI
jgi:hypothetical protein